MAFQIGDTVRLTVGGAWMVVVEVDRERDLIQCKWHDTDQKEQVGLYPPVALEHDDGRPAFEKGLELALREAKQRDAAAG